MEAVEVNGLMVSFDMIDGLESKEKELHKLLRVGDQCQVLDKGVTYRGTVKNIIHLSKGKTLYSVSLDNNPMLDTEFYEGYKVAPLDAMQRILKLTAVDMLLRKYEPKGMSTNVSIYT